jgi:hypothetical protein
MQAQWSEALCLAVLNTFDLKRGNSAAFMLNSCGPAYKIRYTGISQQTNTQSENRSEESNNNIPD